MEISRRALFGLVFAPSILRFWVATAEGQACRMPTTAATPFQFPSNPAVFPRLSIREFSKNANMVSQLRNAVDSMKKMAANNPPLWDQQTSLHCAACAGDPSTDVDIHMSWTFLPWHRAFLYFQERMLGMVSSDSSFRLPYWDWESSQNRTIPDIYGNPANAQNPLFDSRSPAGPLTDPQVDVGNLGLSFADFGGTINCPGNAFSGPHAQVHKWARKGDFFDLLKSANDPIFYAHHANVDRMWATWKSLGGSEPSDTQFQNAKIFFFDENRVWRSVEFQQLLDTRALGYEYDTLMQAEADSHLARVIPLSLMGNAISFTQDDKSRILNTPSATRFLLLRGVDVSALPSQVSIYGVFVSSAPDQRFNYTSPQFLGTFASLTTANHQHQQKCQAPVSLRVTGKVAPIIRNNTPFTLYIYPMDTRMETTGRGIPLRAASGDLLE